MAWRDAGERRGEVVPVVTVYRSWRALLPGRPHPFFTALLFLGWLGLVVGLVAREEARRSTVQAPMFHKIGVAATFSLQEGKQPAVYPEHGPYDRKLGHVAMPGMVSRMERKGFQVTEQAAQSEVFRWLGRRGFTPPYAEKHQAGLRLVDQRGREMSRALYPQRVYGSFAEIPPVLVDTLLFLENRELLEPFVPKQNPVVEWDRLAMAGLIWGADRLGWEQNVPGGSTLATQIEKFRHSPEGRTTSLRDKASQMISASIRVYQRDAWDTREAREALVLSYVNGVPLAGSRGWGDVHGLGDGLWVWFGRDFEEANAALRDLRGGAAKRLRAEVFREALMLMLAQRGPSRLLVHQRARLEALTDAHLRVMRARGVIDAELASAALVARTRLRRRAPKRARPSFVERKGIDTTRNELLRLTGTKTLYALDRLDLTAHTTIDVAAQRAITKLLEHDMHDPAYLKREGFTGKRAKYLLRDGDPKDVTYSFTLYEHVDGENLLRVQVDTHDQPFNINDSAQLDLGSTAKLRTVVTYLDLIAKFYHEHRPKSARELSDVVVPRHDVLLRWTLRQLRWFPKLTLETLLERAMNRVYSASPWEEFMTGGGVHTFANFNDRFDGSFMSVRSAFRHSNNLVMIRLMRDLVRHYRWSKVSQDILYDPYHPMRTVYLKRFVDHDADAYIARFHESYDEEGARNSSPRALMENALRRRRGLGPRQLALLYHTIVPEPVFEEYMALVVDHIAPERLEDLPTMRDIFEQNTPGDLSWNDRGYLLGVHPLELWVAHRMAHDPAISLAALQREREAILPDVYGWLYKPGRRLLQNRKIRTMLEHDAFEAIHAQWASTGYPFHRLVPSLATAIGSSADRPAALAELVGILVSGGVRYPQRRIERVTFAEGTPYEVRLARERQPHRRVLDAEVARVAMRALEDVVANGTARRAKDVFGTGVPIGGKTGTGDHRFETFSRSGRVLSSRAVNRTGTFCFTFDERFSGVMTVFVTGQRSEKYTFTSGMAVETFKRMIPTLQKLRGIGDSPVVRPAKPSRKLYVARDEALDERLAVPLLDSWLSQFDPARSVLTLVHDHAHDDPVAEAMREPGAGRAVGDAGDVTDDAPSVHPIGPQPNEEVLDDAFAKELWRDLTN